MSFNPALTNHEVDAAFSGRFHQSARVADGGQGSVFRGVPVGIASGANDDVAIKLYYPGSQPERTEREISAMGRLNCQTIVRLRDAGQVTIRGQPCRFMATQFVDGRPLSQVIANGPLPVRAVASIGRDIALAIEAMWGIRLVHRDIKPSNIMVTPQGTNILIDLGVARHIDMQPITTVGAAWGTPGYMSPEQMRAQRALSCKSDIFCLGILLQHALCGHHPTGGNQLALIHGGPRTSGLTAGTGSSANPLIAGLIDALVEFQPQRRPLPQQVATVLNQFC